MLYERALHWFNRYLTDGKSIVSYASELQLLLIALCCEDSEECVH